MTQPWICVFFVEECLKTCPHKDKLSHIDYDFACGGVHSVHIPSFSKPRSINNSQSD